MSTSPKERRAKRREKTFSIAKRRRDEHLRRQHFNATTGLTQVDCVCEQADTYFAKRASFGCSCAKRRKGRPKVAKGMCCIGERERIYKWRKENRLLRKGADLDEHHIPARAKKGQGPWVVEKRSLNRAGEPQGAWFAFRRYRGQAGAEAAQKALERSTPMAQFRVSSPEAR